MIARSLIAIFAAAAFTSAASAEAPPKKHHRNHHTTNSTVKPADSTAKPTTVGKKHKKGFNKRVNRPAPSHS